MKPSKFSNHFKRVLLPLHLLLAFGVVYVANRFEAYHFSLVALGYFLYSGLGVAIGFHRLLAHRSFKTYLYAEFFCSLLGCFAAQGSPIFWKALHMGLHHPHTDSDHDIHSPNKGFWHAYIGWQIYLNPQSVPLLAAKDLLSSRFQLFIHKNYTTIYWTPFLVLLFVRLDLAFAFLIVPSFLALHTENLINTFCHMPRFGYQNFQTKDKSRNVPLLGILCFGQGWHNNHHKYPNRYNYGGNRWYEFDPSTWIISMIKKR